MSERAVHVRISGRVQGVGFRDWTARQADGLGLCGWVRNMPDGRVEAVFSGSGAAVDAMLEACRTGPRMADVTSIEELGTPQTPAEMFRILTSP
jgi:acylphosphatase